MGFEEVFVKLKSNSNSSCEETVRILVKIADNILKNPTNSKIRTLQKSNSTIRSKILERNGGSECLQLMGFQETEGSFTLPSTSPVQKLEDTRKALLNLKYNETHQGAIPKQKFEIVPDNNSHYVENDDDLKNVKRFILQPYTPKFTNDLLKRIENCFHRVLAFDDKECQRRAKHLIPLKKLEENAQRNLRYVQRRIKQEKITDPEFSMQDMLLFELLIWFKEDFFTWVDSPHCESCGKQTTKSHMSSDQEDLRYTDRVEVFKCQSCEKLTKFPRYNDLNILLETRKGRCGEWGQVFTLMCRSLGWDARLVIDVLDHMWTEVYSVTQKRWVHCDPCEAICDTPLIYESGWNKKLTYVFACSPEEVQDVTWRYSSNHKELLARRKSCTEDEMISALITLRNERQKTLSQSRRDYLNRRLIAELIDMMIERQPHDTEKHGRTSGSEDWRASRGEITNASTNMYVWKITDKNIIDDKLTIKYSAALDKYEMVKGDGSVMQAHDWTSGVLHYENIFRKEESDWKVVYLTRDEGTSEGSISWKFELDDDTNKVIHSISLKFSHRIFEDAEVDLKLVSDEIILDFPKSDLELVTEIFTGIRHFTVQATLQGGKGNAAWQHAQLFRQPLDSKDYPFVMLITFKSIE